MAPLSPPWNAQIHHKGTQHAASGVRHQAVAKVVVHGHQPYQQLGNNKAQGASYQDEVALVPPSRDTPGHESRDGASAELQRDRPEQIAGVEPEQVIVQVDLVAGLNAAVDAKEKKRDEQRHPVPVGEQGSDLPEQRRERKVRGLSGSVELKQVPLDRAQSYRPQVQGPAQEEAGPEGRPRIKVRLIPVRHEKQDRSQAESTSRDLEDAVGAK